MPVRLAQRLPRYPAVPVAHLRRLAVALAYHGRKLGGTLLWDAVERARRSEVAVYALAVDAKDEQAESFYPHHGCVPFGDTQRTLILPFAKEDVDRNPDRNGLVFRGERSLTVAARISAARVSKRSGKFPRRSLPYFTVAARIGCRVSRTLIKTWAVNAPSRLRFGDAYCPTERTRDSAENFL
jgi:GNAT superfamily N-acetyltransferase